MKVRLLALASAVSSLACLICYSAFVFFLFVDWRLAGATITAGMAFAFLAKWFDLRKCVAIYGDKGRILHDLDWKSGRRIGF